MAKKMLQTVRNAGLAGLFYSTFYSAKLLQAFVFACLTGVSYSIFCSVKMLRVAFSGGFEGILSLLTPLWREGRGLFLAGVTLFFSWNMCNISQRVWACSVFSWKKMLRKVLCTSRKRCNRACPATLEICVTRLWPAVTLLFSKKV